MPKKSAKKGPAKRPGKKAKRAAKIEKIETNSEPTIPLKPGEERVEEAPARV